LFWNLSTEYSSDIRIDHIESDAADYICFRNPKYDLSGADMSDTNLIRASLSRTDLTFANLTGSNLSGADLSGVIGADFSGALNG